MRMLITALRDLQWRLRRFIVAAVGTGLVFALTLVLAGLTNGFRVEGEHVVDALGIDNYVIQSAAVGPFMGSSRFPEEEAGVIARLPGVEAALPVVYGNTILQDGKEPQNVNIYGVPASAMPPIKQGRTPTQPDEIVMSTTMKRAVGDDVQLGPNKLHIVGLVEKSTTLAGQPNAFLTVVGAQQLMFSAQPVVSAVGLRGVPTELPEGYRMVDRTAAVDDMVRPLNGARMALSYMSVLLWWVAGLIVGSLIYLSALERTRDFAVFKALGVTTWMVLAGLALQAVAVAVAAALLGGLLALLLGPLFPMLVAVTGSSFGLLMLTAVVIGLVASLAGVRHAVSVDPVMAFGGP